MNDDATQACIHRSPGALGADARRALLLTYHFPPGQAAGALRWQKFVELGAELGWGFDVVTLDPSGIERPDPTRLQELPPGTRVFGVPDEPLAIEAVEAWLWRVVASFRRPRRAPAAASGGAAAASRASSPAAPARPGSLARDEVRFRAFEPRSTWRAYQAWVDIARNAAWARRAADLAAGLAAGQGYDAVVSSGPPEMAHVGALAVSQRCGLPLVVDMRDPWSLRERLPEHLASPYWYASARRHEARVVAGAAHVVMNTDAACEAMQVAYPGARSKISAIPNGFDEDPLPDVEPAPRFVLAYAGAIYLDRSPEHLFRAAAQVVRELDVSPEEFGIEFMGYVDPLLAIEGRAAEAGLAAHVHLHPAGTRDEAAAFLGRATMLLNLPQDSHMAIPSKIYEYMRLPAHLLVMAEPGSATERLLRDTHADVVAPRDEQAIARILRRRIDDWRRGEKPHAIAADASFGRRARAAAFFRTLERVAAAGRGSDRMGGHEVR